MGGIALVIAPRQADVGGMAVYRVLPFRKRRMVGPFIFLDHMGPHAFPAGRGIDVPPHPHIGLATVTYLLAGSLLHRDSVGSVQTIEPGAVNWMTAGRGIVHSERTPPEARHAPHAIEGLQSWVALPAGAEDGDPAFSHTPAAALPEIAEPGVSGRLVAGTAFGLRSPAKAASPLVYLDLTIAPGHGFSVPADHPERAVYAIAGTIEVNGVRIEPHHLAVLEEGPATVRPLDGQARFAVIGGAPLESPRLIWWNFVASDQGRIDRAKAAWADGRFPAIPGEAGAIPLPA